MKPNKFEKFLGSAFLTGYIPFASGTMGSLLALAIYLIPGFENPTIMLFGISFASAICVFIGTKFESEYGKDPSCCTIDEVAGTWISLLFIPKEALYILLSFLIWRFLDIIKPFPAGRMESLKGGKGILLDDVVSGFYTFLIVNLLIYFIKY